MDEIFVIAEIGHNHQGNINIAKKLISEAKLAGANAVKFQKRDNKNLYTKNFIIAFMITQIVLVKLMASIEKLWS